MILLPPLPLDLLLIELLSSVGIILWIRVWESLGSIGSWNATTSTAGEEGASADPI